MQPWVKQASSSYITPLRIFSTLFTNFGVFRHLPPLSVFLAHFENFGPFGPFLPILTIFGLISSKITKKD